MVNRIDMGEILPPTTFRFTGATPITADQYKNSFVNYFNQYIGGSASLEEQTGIDVDTSEIAGVPISYEEKQDDDSTSILASAFRPENIANFTFGEEAMNSFDNLKRPTIVEDRTELFDDFKGLFRDATDNGIVQTLESATPYAIKTIASAMNPLLGIGVSALTGGEGTNLLANEARKVQADKIDAVRAAMSRGDADAGFVMTFNNLNIVRGPGENFYTGNRQGISFKQLKNLEAVQKGFLPETFRFDRSKDGEDGFFLRGQPINQTIDGSGGIRISDNPLDGFYKANGTFYSPRFGYSKLGMMSHIAKLSATTGLSDTQILEVLSIARSGKGNFGDMIRDLVSPVRSTVDVQQRDLTDKEKESISFQRNVTRADTKQRAKDAGLNEKEADKFAQRAVDYETGNMSDEDIADDLAFNTGGFVQGLAPGGGVGMVNSASGFVDGVPPSQATDAQEVADDKEGKLPEGAFVINASAVTFAGETDIINMLRQAQEEAVRRGVTADNPEASSMIDVAVSRGEVVVAPYLVNIIGKDRLEKINNRGIKDTERKIDENGQQAQAVAKGGFLDMNNGGEVSNPFDDYIDVPQETIDKFASFGAKKQKRADINKFIDSLTDEEAIALTLLTETTAITTPLEGMQAIGEVIVNRKNAQEAGFKNANTVKDVLKKQTKVGAYEFSGLEPSVLYERLREIRRGTVPKQALQKVFAAAQNVLDPETEGQRMLSERTLFYTRADAKSQWMRTAPNLEYATEIGEHEFYRTFASPEFP